MVEEVSVLTVGEKREPLEREEDAREAERKQHKSHKEKKHKKEHKERKEEREKKHHKEKKEHKEKRHHKDKEKEKDKDKDKEKERTEEDSPRGKDKQESPEPGEIPAETAPAKDEVIPPEEANGLGDGEKEKREEEKLTSRGGEKEEQRVSGHREQRERSRDMERERREREREGDRRRGRERERDIRERHRSRDERDIRERHRSRDGRDHRGGSRRRSRTPERRGNERQRGRYSRERRERSLDRRDLGGHGREGERRGASRDRRGPDFAGLRGDRHKEESEPEEDIVEEVEEVDEDALIEARRRRLAAIKEKHAQQQQDQLQKEKPKAVSEWPPTASVEADGKPASGDTADAGDQNNTAAPAETGAPANHTYTTTQATDKGDSSDGDTPQRVEDYDDEDVAGHNEDSAEDVELLKEGGERSIGDDGKARDQPGQGMFSGERDSELKSGLKPAEAKKEVVPDMFAEDEEADDMFAKTPTGADGAPTKAEVNAAKGLLDNWDDADGYYQFKTGEVLLDKYKVTAAQGRGVFSSVFRAQDVSRQPGAPNEVCIKVIRNNEVMYKAGQLEKEILNLLAREDKDGKRHCVQMLASFEYRNHLCLVFESMSMNLRELVKKYGRDVGLNIGAVQKYAEQLMIGLHHMHRCKILHADIKPDNILVNDRHTIVKFCDFGSAMYAGDNDVTPYLVSRFYRAPEIILGLKYDTAMDMWSVGCVLYELFTGKILFPGRTNNEMLKHMMAMKGPFPKKMLRKGSFADNHFEGETLDEFCLLEEDPVTKQPVRRLIKTSKIQTKTFADVCLTGSTPDTRKKLQAFADLLEKCFTLDPDKRITAKQALAHPFISSARQMQK
eukprot:CAMPEP_0177793834 /NCGR_PEP_ID=MMETSP0491_2-20121128/25303_1 /TAXON_ID=63592 /ORGANISM="Tetraselmis chuii, Strain PLY429" /LENGTH=845 /DNA_ID=CAMNT_0019316409 /DNA_START=173 /DNA_END=2710 /DNA_ORIENTATION=+